MSLLLAHRVISQRCGIWSLSGHSGHRPAAIKLLRAMRDQPKTRLICPTGSFAKFVSSPPAKNISLVPSGKSPPLIQPSRPTRGTYRDRHGRWARDAMDAAVSLTSDTKADGEVV